MAESWGGHGGIRREAIIADIALGTGNPRGGGCQATVLQCCLTSARVLNARPDPGTPFSATAEAHAELEHSSTEQVSGGTNLGTRGRQLHLTYDTISCRLVLAVSVLGQLSLNKGHRKLPGIIIRGL